MTPRIAKSNAPRHRLSNRKCGGWMKDRPKVGVDYLISDKLGDLPRGAIENPSLNPALFPKIRDQGSQGSCGGFQARSCLVYKFYEKYGDKVAGKWGQTWDLSPGAIYFRTREIHRTVYEDSGVEIRAVWDAMRKHGAPTEKDAPYKASTLITRLSAAAVTSGKWHQSTPTTYRCDDPRDGGSREKVVDRMLQALAAGMPINSGFSCPKNWGDFDDTGVVPLPDASGFDGGHATTHFWADTAARLFGGPNSWGNDSQAPAPPGARFNERGYLLLPFQYYIDGNADDAWVVDIE
jgi:hypothetical protein